MKIRPLWLVCSASLMLSCQMKAELPQASVPQTQAQPPAVLSTLQAPAARCHTGDSTGGQHPQAGPLWSTQITGQSKARLYDYLPRQRGTAKRVSYPGFFVRRSGFCTNSGQRPWAIKPRLCRWL